MTWLGVLGSTRIRSRDSNSRASAFVWNTFSKLPCAKLPPHSFLFLRTSSLGVAAWSCRQRQGALPGVSSSPVRARMSPSPLAGPLRLAAQVNISSWSHAHSTPRTRVTPTNKPSHSLKDMSHLTHQASPFKCRFRSLARIPRPTQITHAHSQNSRPSAPVHTRAHTIHLAPRDVSTPSPKTQPRVPSKSLLRSEKGSL